MSSCWSRDRRYQMVKNFKNTPWNFGTVSTPSVLRVSTGNSVGRLVNRIVDAHFWFHAQKNNRWVLELRRPWDELNGRSGFN